MNSKQKGNTFERKICEALSLWLTNGEETRACWRSDTSGGAATILSRKGKERKYVEKNTGDIRQIADKGDHPALDNFFEAHVVECKAYKAIDFYPPFNGTLRGFLEQCIEESLRANKEPVLILKANNRKIMFFHTDKMFGGMTPPITIRHRDLVMHGYLLDEILSAPYPTQPVRKDTL